MMEEASSLLRVRWETGDDDGEASALSGGEGADKPRVSGEVAEVTAAEDAGAVEEVVTLEGGLSTMEAPVPVASALLRSSSPSVLELLEDAEDSSLAESTMTALPRALWRSTSISIISCRLRRVSLLRKRRMMVPSGSFK